MRHTTRPRSLLCLAATVAVAVCTTGCGKKPSTTTTDPQKAHALLAATYSSGHQTGLEYMHASTPSGQDLLAATGVMLQYSLQLRDAMRDRFGQDNGERFNLLWSDVPPRLVSGDATGAVYEYTGIGRTYNVRMLPVNDRWHVDFEAFVRACMGADVDQALATTRSQSEIMKTVTPDIVRRIEAGEFQNVGQANVAMDASVRAARAALVNLSGGASNDATTPPSR